VGSQVQALKVAKTVISVTSAEWYILSVLLLNGTKIKCRIF
jgi:hypothetical protein